MTQGILEFVSIQSPENITSSRFELIQSINFDAGPKFYGQQNTKTCLLFWHTFYHGPFKQILIIENCFHSKQLLCLGSCIRTNHFDMINSIIQQLQIFFVLCFWSENYICTVYKTQQFYQYFSEKNYFILNITSIISA